KQEESESNDESENVVVDFGAGSNDADGVVDEGEVEVKSRDSIARWSNQNTRMLLGKRRAQKSIYLNALPIFKPRD
ncbi:hypothetical protein L195_g055562, partial [Trifolium pratense]